MSLIRMSGSRPALPAWVPGFARASQQTAAASGCPRHGAPTGGSAGPGGACNCGVQPGAAPVASSFEASASVQSAQMVAMTAELGRIQAQINAILAQAGRPSTLALPAQAPAPAPFYPAALAAPTPLAAPAALAAPQAPPPPIAPPPPPPAPLAPPAPVALAPLPTPVAPAVSAIPAPAAAAIPAPAPAPAPPAADPAAASATAASQPVLRRKADGAAVRELQQRLVAHGFDPGGVDGAFGPRTEAAVRAFQQAKGLAVDGIVGPKTWAKLAERPSAEGPAKPAPGNGDGSGPMLRNGVSGDPVRKLQDRLRALGFNPGGTDGAFGNQTEATVRALQAARGLAADGVVGPATWKALGIHVTGDLDRPSAAPSGPSGSATLDGKPMVYRGGKPIHAHLSADWDRMVAAAARAGVRLSVTSGYRTVAEQQVLWDQALRKYGSADAARKWVAPPGKSNHQSGKAIDVGASDGHAWLRAHGREFGFSQPMSWEPWHWEHAV